MIFSDKPFIRNIDAGNYLETFLITGFTSILAIRFYLKFTGYPQVGHGNFHIAHMLWGGFFMVAAIILLLTYLNRSAMQWATILGGIGFGTFIDELGKFITSDNNYFYQPAVALIYCIFILLFLIFRTLEKKQFSEMEYLMNAIEALEEVVFQNLDREEKKNMIQLLRKSGQKNPVTKSLKTLIKDIESIPAQQKTFIERVQDSIASFYHSIIATRWFAIVVISFFIIRSVYALINTILILRWGIIFLVIIPVYLALAWIFRIFRHHISRLRLSFILILLFGSMMLLAQLYYILDEFLPLTLLLPHLSLMLWIELLSSGGSAILVLLGVVRFYHARLSAYRFFKNAILLSIFITRIFSFYHQQLSAILGLGLDLIILGVLQYSIYQEELNRQDEIEKTSHSSHPAQANID